MNTLVRRLLDTCQEPFFSDVEVTLADKNPSSRHAHMHRAMKQGDIIRIKRGLYCFGQHLRKKPLNLLALAGLVKSGTYISMESALSSHGWIPEEVTAVTSVTSGRQLTFGTPVGMFIYTHVTQEVFFRGVEQHTSGTVSWLEATPLKALADYIYVRRLKWTSVEPLYLSLRINEDALAGLTDDDFAQVMGNYPTAPRVERFLENMRKEILS